MPTFSEMWPIGVFTSIDTGLGVRLDVARELGVSTIHLHAPSRQQREPHRVRELKARFAELRLAVTTVFAGFEGESYADIPTTQRTVGLVPEETRATRLAEMREISDFAHALGAPTIGLHIGFIPHESTHPVLYGEIVAVTQSLCEHSAKHGQEVHLETGQ